MLRPDKFHVGFMTGPGLAYISGSLAFLAAGIFRGELIATISGITFLSFALFSCLAALFSYAAWKKVSLSAEWKEPGLFRVSICGTEKEPFLSLVFSEILYCLDYTTSGKPGTGRFFSIGVPVLKTATDHTLELPPRGIYTPSNPRLRIGDYAGFFSFTIRLDGSDLSAPLTVFPASETDPNTALPPGKTGRTRGKSTFKRSEDLYETRNYQPGDDPRKINWKVFAHSGELSIRQGELLPPPANEYVFMLWNGISRMPSPEDKSRYDILLARASILAALLLSKNRSVTILTADTQNRLWRASIHPSDSGASDTARQAFSIPQLDPESPPIGQLLAAAPEYATCLLFTLNSQLSGIRLPGSAAARTTVYIGPVPDAPEPRSIFRKLRDLVFFKSGVNVRPNTQETVRAFKDVEAYLKKEGFDVKTI